MSQIFDTNIGKEYMVKFHVYASNSSMDSSDDAELKWYIRENNGTGNIITQPLITPSLNSAWTQYSFTFTATTTSTYISVENTTADDIGSSLDNIIITEQVSNPPVFNNNNGNVYPYDPTNQQLKAIPGQVMVFDTTLINTGGSPDANSSGTRTLYYTASVSSDLAFEINSIVYEDDKKTLTTAFGDPASGSNWTSSGIDPSTLLCCGTSGD